jgi:aspartate/methionine/tyrosine aminotransferase
MAIEIESPEEFGYDKIDCNLTESSFSDASLKELDLNLNDLILSYGSHTGKKELRELLASEHSHLQPEHFLITAGAASGLFIISTSLLKPGDRLLVAKPNYATNIETPRAIGADVDFLNLKFEEGFKINIDTLAQKITPQTKLVSITYPHNPTGSTISVHELQQIVDLIESRGISLVFDETYREMCFGEILPSASQLSKNVISVSSLSKTYGLPGIRVGWIVCRDPQMMETFLAAKEQIMICNSIVDEEIAFRFLLKKNQRLPEIHKKIRAHFEIVNRWMGSEQNLEWVEPSGGVVCFPRIKKQSEIDVTRFYQTLNSKYKTFVGPGHWFEMDRSYMRIGYGWPMSDELQKGLQNISLSLDDSKR